MDKALARSIRMLQNRARTRPPRRPRAYRPGAHALRYMTIGALMTETYRQYVETGGSLSQLSSGILGSEFARRGFQLASGVVTGLPTQLDDLTDGVDLRKITEQIDDPSVSDAQLERELEAHVDAWAEDSGVASQAASDPGRLTQTEFLEDLRAQGVPERVSEAFSFAEQFSPNDLGEAVAAQEQLAHPEPAVDLLQEAATDNTDAPQL